MAIGQSSRKLKPKGLEKVFYSLASKLFKSEPVQTEFILKPGEILPILDGLEVLDTKGHTPGHISFFFRNSGILFAGDSIKLINNHLSPSIGANTWEMDLSRKSFDYQMSLNPRYICAGHAYIDISKD
jgi:glyoxylase-like metal-dependent hydrolase (beta-lactamase superfamily II)